MGLNLTAQDLLDNQVRWHLKTPVKEFYGFLNLVFISPSDVKRRFNNSSPNSSYLGA